MKIPSTAYRSLSVAVFLACLPHTQAHAQLLREELREDGRLCTYLGSEQRGDVTAPRTLLVELSRPCPATAPFVDPNAPVPGNAQLVGEETTGRGRICLYTQGGIEYRVATALTRPCAMTPGLLERERSRTVGGAFPSASGSGTPW